MGLDCSGPVSELLGTEDLFLVYYYIITYNHPAYSCIPLDGFQDSSVIRVTRMLHKMEDKSTNFVVKESNLTFCCTQNVDL
jgi:hypothetical protein